jgi:hypothetical protein
MVSSDVLRFFCLLAYTFGSFSYGRTLVRNIVLFLLEENYWEKLAAPEPTRKYET